MPEKCSSRRGGSGIALIAVEPTASTIPLEPVGQRVRTVQSSQGPWLRAKGCVSCWDGGCRNPWGVRCEPGGCEPSRRVSCWRASGGSVHDLFARGVCGFVRRGKLSSSQLCGFMQVSICRCSCRCRFRNLVFSCRCRFRNLVFSCRCRFRYLDGMSPSSRCRFRNLDCLRPSSRCRFRNLNVFMQVAISQP